jgi:hypothetical protein
MKYNNKQYRNRLKIIILSDVIIFFLLFVFFFNIKNILIGGWLFLFFFGIIIPYLVLIGITIKYIFFRYDLKKEKPVSLNFEEE